MKTPYKSNTVEYSKSSSKRKKPATPPPPATSTAPNHNGVVYSERSEVPWEEQKTLPPRFHDSGPHTWPALKVIGERGAGKRKEYLLEWEPHPYTQEIFRPTWTLAGSVGDALIEDWKKNKKPSTHKSRESNAIELNGESEVNDLRRAKYSRTIQDFSSEISSQNAASPSPGASLSQQLPSSNATKPPTRIRLSFTTKASTTSSPAEIAETQQETSEGQLVSVTIPAAAINKADYESLRSSQISSNGGLRLSSPLKSQTNSSQPGPSESPTKSRPFPSSTPLTNRQKTSAKLSVKPSTPSVNLTNSVAVNDQQEFLNDTVASSNRTRLQDALSNSSESSSRFGTPDYVPSTGQELISGRAASVELGSRSGHRGLTIAELVSPQKGTHDQATQNTRLPPVSRDSIPGNTYPQPVTETQNPTHTVSNSVLQAATQASTLQNSQTGGTSSPWAFQTQVLVEEKRTIRNTASVKPSPPGPFVRGRLFQSSASPTRSDKPARQAASPASVSSSPSFSDRLRQARASALSQFARSSSQVTDSVSRTNVKVKELSPPIDMDLSVTPSVTSPAADNPDATSREFPLEPAIVPENGSQAQVYDIALGSSALPIQNSIEEEQPLNDDEASDGSKGSSSQQSLENERDIAQVDGLVLPSLPLFGPAEYALGLPAEGKIQSTYFDIIKSKKKAILKFINRHEAIGSSNGSPNRTHERNEMNELIQRLHNTTTHLDLGLPGFSTQLATDSQQHAAYANYAGSKFSLLGHLVDVLKAVECSIVIVAQSGSIQDLLEQYLSIKQVNVRRHDRIVTSQSQTSNRPPPEFQIELVSTMSTYEVNLNRKPLLMIAFDASFDAQDPQVKRLRTGYSNRSPNLLPVIHLLVTNSSEHVDICIPKSMPSPLRLKLLVRATYQAHTSLGGKATYVPSAADEPDGRAMDFSDLQRALRKSPERKLVILASMIARAAMSSDFDAHWNLGSVPALTLNEVDITPPKASGTTTVADTPKEPAQRTRSPVSRAETPSGKKRLLEVDGAIPALNKRQRLTPTPLREIESRNAQVTQPVQLQDIINRLQAELAQEKEARQKAEQEKETVHKQLEQWKSDHASLLRRYEKRMTKTHELESSNSKLLKTIEANKSRQERFAEDNISLKQKVKGLQQELATARDEIMSSGGDAAIIETAREESRSLLAKNIHLEKSLENTRKDFEFTRTQYQDASNKAAEFATQVRDLEAQVADLTKQATDEKRRLKETNYQTSTRRHLLKIAEMEQERKTRDVLLKKLEEENRQLKRNRGVQTRGSSVQPPGSPGLDGPGGGRGPRSRQNSPAPGLFAHSTTASLNRGSLLRH